MEEKKILKERFEEKVIKVSEWCKEHKETIVVFGPVIISGVIEIIKISTKKSMVDEEKTLKDQYIYDRSTGHYYELKKKPRSSEWVQIDLRKQHGEMLGLILEDMKLLK